MSKWLFPRLQTHSLTAERVTSCSLHSLNLVLTTKHPDICHQARPTPFYESKSFPKTLITPGWSIAVERSRDIGEGACAAVVMNAQEQAKPQIQPCRYKTGKTLGAGSYSVVKECVHIDTGRYYAAKVINKRMMQGREHMVCFLPELHCNCPRQKLILGQRRYGTR